MSFITSCAVLGEGLLSLYPILVKSISANLFTQVFVRVLTFVIISYFFISTSLKAIISNPLYCMISLLNLIHIYTSYVGFLNLDVGVALSIFYIYPLINVLIKSLFINHSIDLNVVLYFIISIVGVIVINIKDPTKMWKITPKTLIGIVAILIAALSESLIYTFYKTVNQSNPFDSLFTLYFFGGILLFIFVILTRNNQQILQINNTRDITILIIANILIGIIGHILRFYSIPKITTEWFSILAFIEVIFGYLFGWFFLGEKITKWHLMGTSLIIYSVYKINSLGYL